MKNNKNTHFTKYTKQWITLKPGKYNIKQEPPGRATVYSLLTFLSLSFERELKNKLAEKTKGAQSEESVLKKAFKYFDLNDNGTVEPDEFAKAIEKIGIQIPTKQVSIGR